MSIELVNRITVKKDGVYVSSHSSNDTASFHSHRIEWLSKVYTKEGQKGLDREIIEKLFDSWELRGSHKSLERYRYAMNSEKGHMLCQKYISATREKFYAMNKEDRNSVWYNPTEKAAEYNAFELEQKNILYTALAEICSKYDDA